MASRSVFRPSVVVPLVAFGLAVGVAMLAKTVTAASADQPVVLNLTRAADPGRGARLFDTTCAQCHGTTGRGMPHQGASLKDSPFVAGHDDRALIAFVRRGRTPDDPDSVMKQYMPAKGGVISFNDNDLQDIVAHVRQLTGTTQAATPRVTVPQVTTPPVTTPTAVNKQIAFAR